MLNIVIPMAGLGSRFAKAGYTTPKPLINVGGKPMIQWVVENISPSMPHRFIFICQKKHLKEYPEIQPTLEAVAPGCVIIPINKLTEGPACTVLLAKKYINTTDPLMIANSDQYVDFDIDEYLSMGEEGLLDGWIMTFWAEDPKWSYCKMTREGYVRECVEKKVVSNEATVGIYNFMRGCDFVTAAEEMISRDIRTNNEFYVAPSYNMLIEKGAQVATYNIGEEGDGMYGLGIPEDLEFFKTTECYRQGSLEMVK